MYWLFLLFALGALTVAFTASSTVVILLCLLVSLACFLAWAMGFYSARVGSARVNAMPIIDPLELRRLREQAEARKATTQTQTDED
jgi:hypothetical protein